eukprot:2996959-Amphidinium_carterae.1
MQQKILLAASTTDMLSVMNRTLGFELSCMAKRMAGSSLMQSNRLGFRRSTSAQAKLEVSPGSRVKPHKCRSYHSPSHPVPHGTCQTQSIPSPLFLNTFSSIYVSHGFCRCR